MAIGIDEIDEYNYEDGREYIPSEEPQINQGKHIEMSEEQADFLQEYLKSKGISDMSKIMFEDENNNLIERSWDDLSQEERFNILNSSLEEPQTVYKNDLTPEEAEFLQNLRNSGLTPNQYIESFQENYEPHYNVDDLSDDELFMLDLESRVGELPDDQLEAALNLAKQNEDLYTKQIAGIRKEYKEREDYQNQQEEAARELEQQEQFEYYRTVVSEAIENLTSVGNLDVNLEDADREDLAEFILSQNQDGENYLAKALQDPQTLVKAAWFILNGDEAFNNIEDYFADQIKKISEARYKQGYEDAKKGNPNKTIVISKPTSPKERPVYRSIEDLD